jgi:hypothetical protein
MNKRSDILNILLFVIWATMFFACTAPGQNVYKSSPQQAALIKTVPDWRLSGSLGWLFYFDGYVGTYFTRQQLVLQLDSAVGDRPIGFFKANGPYPQSDCSGCLLKIRFKSQQQLNQYLYKEKLTSWTYQPYFLLEQSSLVAP